MSKTSKMSNVRRVVLNTQDKLPNEPHSDCRVRLHKPVTGCRGFQILSAHTPLDSGTFNFHNDTIEISQTESGSFPQVKKLVFQNNTHIEQISLPNAIYNDTSLLAILNDASFKTSDVTFQISNGNIQGAFAQSSNERRVSLKAIDESDRIVVSAGLNLPGDERTIQTGATFDATTRVLDYEFEQLTMFFDIRRLEFTVQDTVSGNDYARFLDIVPQVWTISGFRDALNTNLIVHEGQFQTQYIEPLLNIPDTSTRTLTYEDTFNGVTTTLTANLNFSYASYQLYDVLNTNFSNPPGGAVTWAVREWGQIRASYSVTGGNTRSVRLYYTGDSGVTTGSNINVTNNSTINLEDGLNVIGFSTTTKYDGRSILTFVPNSQVNIMEYALKAYDWNGNQIYIGDLNLGNQLPNSVPAGSTAPITLTSNMLNVNRYVVRSTRFPEQKQKYNFDLNRSYGISEIVTALDQNFNNTGVSFFNAGNRIGVNAIIPLDQPNGLLHLYPNTVLGITAEIIITVETPNAGVSFQQDVDFSVHSNATTIQFTSGAVDYENKTTFQPSVLYKLPNDVLLTEAEIATFLSNLVSFLTFSFVDHKINIVNSDSNKSVRISKNDKLGVEPQYGNSVFLDPGQTYTSDKVLDQSTHIMQYLGLGIYQGSICSQKTAGEESAHADDICAVLHNTTGTQYGGYLIHENPSGGPMLPVVAEQFQDIRVQLFDKNFRRIVGQKMPTHIELNLFCD